MLFLLTGAAGSGKSAALRELSVRRSDLAVFDLDDLRPPVDASRWWWRARIDAHVLRALEEEAAGRDTVFAGWTTIEQVMAAPSSAALEGVAACLLDCDDDVRVQRVEQRAASGTWRLHTREELTGFLEAAAEMRKAAGGYFRLDTSRLTVAAVADHLEEWMSLEKYAAWVLLPRLPDRPVRPGTSYFVCGTPRSGSWLLCGLLVSTGVAGRPHEWFWCETEVVNRRAWGVSRFADYLARVRDAGTTPNGVFGSKLMWAYLDDLLARLRHLGDASSHRSLIARHFPTPLRLGSARRRRRSGCVVGEGDPDRPLAPLGQPRPGRRSRLRPRSDRRARA
jgi:hypothetical protein